VHDDKVENNKGTARVIRRAARTRVKKVTVKDQTLQEGAEDKPTKEKLPGEGDTRGKEITGS